MTVIDGRFHIENNQIIKTSNGEVLQPSEEPLIVMRARDHLMLPTLRFYRELAVADGCNDWFLDKVDERIKAFEQFTLDFPERMKQPGITKGK